MQWNSKLVDVGKMMEVHNHHLAKICSANYFRHESSIDAKYVGKRMMRNRIFVEFQSVSHKTLIKYNGANDDFRLEKSCRYRLNQVIDQQRR